MFRHVPANKGQHALKARLRRLCEPKKGGRLQVPQWLHDMWKPGDHLKLAQEFQSCNFNKETIEKMFGFKMFQVLTTIPRIETLAYSSTSPTSSPLSKLLFWIQSAPVLAGSVHSVQDQNPDQERDECECHLQWMVYQGRYGENLEVACVPCMQSFICGYLHKYSMVSICIHLAGGVIIVDGFLQLQLKKYT